MTFLFIQDWFSTAMIKAIGWTLIHSLWQGVLLAIVTGLLILFTRRSAPALRYKLLSALFVAFILCCGITFCLEWQHLATANQLIPKSTGNPATTYFSPGINETQPTSSFLSVQQFIDYFNTHAPLIVTIWFIIFLLKCVRLATNIGYARRLRHRQSFDVLPYWQEKTKQLAAIMKIKATVFIRESAIVKVPVVIGLLKPVILIPLGILANLPAEQVEAILLHELAHIRRKDYLVNLLQCFGETVFFFNPAVLWLSSLIRLERENCCDDMAIAVTGNKSTLIHALVAFQDYGPANTFYAPAFPGEKYPVLQRVKRIVYNNNKNLNNMEKIFLSSGLVLTTVLIVAFTTHKNNSPVPVKPVAQKVVKLAPQELRQPISVKDTTPDDPKKKSTITGTVTTMIDGKDYTIILKNGAIKGLFIDQERVADEKVGDYKKTTDKILTEWTAGKKDHLEKLLAEKEMTKHTEGKEYAERARMLDMQMEQIQKMKQKSGEYNQQMKKLHDEELMLELEYKKEDNHDREVNSLMEHRKNQEMHQEHAKEMEYNLKLQYESLVEKSEADKKGQEFSKNFVNDLLDQKIIGDDQFVAVRLTPDELVVNGVTLSDSIHKKFKKKYLKDSKGTISFTYSDNTNK